jgi:hypothetical protein
VEELEGVDIVFNSTADSPKKNLYQLNNNLNLIVVVAEEEIYRQRRLSDWIQKNTKLVTHFSSLFST